MEIRTKMTEETYETLIAEAFIDPIRTVLIVDDDYPTLHEILLDPDKREEKHGHKDWNRSPADRAKVRSVIDEFRSPNGPYLLDIHDGTSPAEEIDEQNVGTLQQTDFLVLDYQLDKTKADGAKAIRYAREALTNDHFNLILVHTQEDLDRVFHEFLFGLLQPSFAGCVMEEPSEELQEFLDDHEDALLQSILDPQYASAARCTNSSRKFLNDAVQKGHGAWAGVSAVLESGGLRRRFWLPAVQHALRVFEKENSARFAGKDVEVVEWSDDHPRFIRAKRGFVAFKKKDDGKQLVETMRDAILAWEPRPSRLMLTKLRAEMNARGIEVQDDALGDAEVAAVWYLRLLKADNHNLEATIAKTVNNHSEQLLDKLLPSVFEFSKRMRNLDVGSDPVSTVRDRFGINLEENGALSRAKVGHNAFVGSKPMQRDHLEVGHLLRIKDDYWVCVTPACDMVPNQDRGDPYDRIDDIKRFTALKLKRRTNPVMGLNDAHEGGQIFARVKLADGSEERMAFSLGEKPTSSPSWMTMYADNNGVFENKEHPVCRVSYVVCSDASSENGAPKIEQSDARVCGMLRYEYALEIQSRFTGSQSRIGLDFENVDERSNESTGTAELSRGNG